MESTPDRYRVVVTDSIFTSFDQERAVLEPVGARLEIRQAPTEEELIEACNGADALLNWFAPLTRRVLNRLNRCRVIVRYGVGVDPVDVAAASELGIWVCNVPDYGVDEVSSHALALMLAVRRRLVEYDAHVRSGRWDFNAGRPIHRIGGNLLGLVGFGQIAQDLARKAMGIGLKVMAYSPNCPDAAFKALGVRRCSSLDELFSTSDIVSLHASLRDGTRGMVGEALLRLMKPSAILVNTARGQLVDEPALVRALREDWIIGAALDVVAREPVDSENPLLGLPNVLLSPHVAFYSEEALLELQRKAAEEVARVLSGESPLHPVNPQIRPRNIGDIREVN